MKGKFAQNVRQFIGELASSMEGIHSVKCFMPWLCVDHMIQQGVWPMGSSYPDPLAKSRPTGKIQTHWLGHKVVHTVTRNIKN